MCDSSYEVLFLKIFRDPLDLIHDPLSVPGVDQALDSLTRAVQHHVPRGRLADDVCLLLLQNGDSADVEGEKAWRSLGKPAASS